MKDLDLKVDAPATEAEVRAAVTTEAFSLAMDEFANGMETAESLKAQENVARILGNVLRLINATGSLGDRRKKAMLALNHMAEMSDNVVMGADLASETNSPQRTLFEDDPGLKVGDDLDK